MPPFGKGNRKFERQLMRITGGKARGIQLAVPQGAAVRPATDAMRQAVFSSIAGWLAGAKFFDMFAGSGAYGLEAVSRGAARGAFVEKDARTAEYIRKNIAAVCKSMGRPREELQVINSDATTAPLAFVPDLVFIDPPYDQIPEVAAQLFERLTPLVAEKADPLIIFEMPGEISLSPAGWTCVKRLGKGKQQPTVCIFRTSQALT